MPGGTLRRETASLIGVDGLEILQKFNIQKGFFGAHGISLPEGLTDVSADEAAVKRPLVAMCRQVVAVLDATKWGRVGLASFAGLEDVDCIITDRDAPADLVEQVRALGIEVILV
jgi:DeoR/GlpR family transcriptional regulator of sugar metabolism